MTKALEINNLTKTYGDGTEALKGISLDIQEGEFYALLGANGAGKTTLIGIMTDLVTKTSGTLKVFGQDIDTHIDQAKQLIGVVPQEINFNNFEKSFDILVTQAGFYGIPQEEATAEAERLLKALSLWDKRNTISRNLSGGMRRRLMIARALVSKPKILILDEPTAGVDVDLRVTMWEFIRELHQQGLTILLTTHYLEEVEQLCQKAAIIKDGKIIKADLVKNLVGLVQHETFVVTVENIHSLEKCKMYHPAIVDENTIEFSVNKEEGLNDFIAFLTKVGLQVTDLRPKGNRMESLFLDLLKKD